MLFAHKEVWYLALTLKKWLCNICCMYYLCGMGMSYQILYIVSYWVDCEKRFAAAHWESSFHACPDTCHPLYPINTMQNRSVCVCVCVLWPKLHIIVFACDFDERAMTDTTMIIMRQCDNGNNWYLSIGELWALNVLFNKFFHYNGCRCCHSPIDKHSHVYAKNDATNVLWQPVYMLRRAKSSAIHDSKANMHIEHIRMNHLVVCELFH